MERWHELKTPHVTRICAPLLIRLLYTHTCTQSYAIARLPTNGGDLALLAGAPTVSQWASGSSDLDCPTRHRGTRSCLLGKAWRAGRTRRGGCTRQRFVDRFRLRIVQLQDLEDERKGEGARAWVRGTTREFGQRDVLREEALLYARLMVDRAQLALCTAT